MSRLFSQMLGSVTCGDCTDVMAYLPAACVDFILTDPPFICNYRPHKNNAGQTVRGDIDGDWLTPAFAQMYRLLKPDSFCVTFYGWNAADRFMQAWKQAGFRAAGHLVFRKRYASSSRFLQYRHEQAYLLAALERQEAIIDRSPQTPGKLAPFEVEGVDPTEQAAWVTMSSVLLNLDEFITRE